METQPKWFLTSKTIIGILASVLPTLLPMFGVELMAQDGQLFTSLADHIITLGGAALAVWGRFSVSQPVSVVPKP